MQASDINTAIVSAVKDLGGDVLKSATLVGVLSDYHAFNVHDPLLSEKKLAISTLAASDYVEKLLKWQQQPTGKWQQEDSKWIEALCKKHGLERHVVGMMADAMKEAVGLEIPFTEFSDYQQMLASEIRKYHATLKKVVSTYTDQLGITVAFFSTSANTVLYRMEGYILILAQATNKSTYNGGWINATRKKIVKSLSTNPHQRDTIINAAITFGLAEYNKIIDQQRQIGKSGAMMFTGGEVDRLKRIAEKVNYAFRLIPKINRLDVDRDMSAVKKEVEKYIQQQKVQREIDTAKTEYQQLLKGSLIVEEDCLGLATARYNFDKHNKINALERKLLSYAKEISLSDTIERWIRSERDQLIVENSTPKDQNHSVARRALSEDGAAYAKLLEEQTSIGKRSRKAFDDISQLSRLADRLNRAFEIIGDNKRIDVGKDVARAKSVIKSYRLRVILIASTVVALIIGLAILFTADKINYNKNRPNIEAFNNTITEGDNALSDGNLIDALSLYQEAKEEYTPNYKSSNYSEVATERIEEVSEKIYEEYTVAINKLLADGKCKEAKQKYEGLLLLNISDDLTTYSKEFSSNLKDAVEKGKDNLLKSISQNKGNPSSEDITKIEDLLYCMPDDYYLNLIKSKIK